MYKGQQGYRMIVGVDLINLTWKFLKNSCIFERNDWDIVVACNVHINCSDFKNYMEHNKEYVESL
jgi:hypothetical protein